MQSLTQEAQDYARIGKQLLVLNPQHDQELCQAVIDETRAYRRRPPLSTAGIAFDEQDAWDILHDLERDLDRECQLLSATLKPIQGEAVLTLAYHDWKLRDAAVMRPTVHEWIRTHYLPVHEYFAVLHEVLEDLQFQHRLVLLHQHDLGTAIMSSVSLQCAAILLARTPIALLERIRRTSLCECPGALLKRSWEQPLLLPWIRYAPTLSYPTGNAPPAYRWRTRNGNSILAIHSETICGILKEQRLILDPHERERVLPDEAFACLMLWNPDLVEGWMLHRHGVGTLSFPGSRFDLNRDMLEDRIYGRFRLEALPHPPR
ncbi:hypothetical protein JCM10908_000120 [Rhodotorula pacifica]|uniref:uncharacterized protein n=1 Tax=Rhodotorula pacifica TaxID=1495444 RepID=UPI00316BE16B